MVAFGFAVGPLLGGVLAEKAGWRWCFWVTVPVSLCAVIFVSLVLPLKPVEGNFGKKLAVVDYLGTVLTLGGCTLVILPLIWVRLSPSRFERVSNHGFIGRCYVPVELAGGVGAAVLWGSGRCPVLSLGMEGSATPDHPK